MTSSRERAAGWAKTGAGENGGPRQAYRLIADRANLAYWRTKRDNAEARARSSPRTQSSQRLESALARVTKTELCPRHFLSSCGKGLDRADDSVKGRGRRDSREVSSRRNMAQTWAAKTQGRAKRASQDVSNYNDRESRAHLLLSPSRSASQAFLFQCPLNQAASTRAWQAMPPAPISGVNAPGAPIKAEVIGARSPWRQDCADARLRPRRDKEK